MINFLTEEEKKRVNHAVERAEVSTAGEIIPMIVRRSSMIGHVLPQVFSLLFIVVLLLNILIKDFYSSVYIDWVTLVGFLLIVPLSFWLRQVPSVQRLMTPVADLEFEVFERAKLEFYESNIHKTVGGTGILIFISLMERQCVVLAGEAIAKKMPKETWDQVVSLTLAGIKNKRPAEGLINAIDLCGKILTEHYPIQAGDTNELANAVIVKE